MTPYNAEEIKIAISTDPREAGSDGTDIGKIGGRSTSIIMVGQLYIVLNSFEYGRLAITGAGL